LFNRALDLRRSKLVFGSAICSPRVKVITKHPNRDQKDSRNSWDCAEIQK
jgi:hypothetical protein